MAVVITEGPFGEAVGRMLADDGDWVMRSLQEERAGGFPSLRGHPYAALATWRPPLGTVGDFESACRTAGLRYSFAFPDGRWLFVGPSCAAGHAPCFECFRRRLVTHTSGPERRLALEAAFRADPSLGAPGHLPMMIEMAVGSLRRDAAGPLGPTGSVVQVDLLECALQRSQVVRVHGCPTCAPAGEGHSPRRFVDHLIPAMRARGLI